MITAKSNYIPPNDPAFNTHARMTVMLILCSHRKAGFTELQKLLNLTSGNLEHHLRVLEKAGYITSRKAFFPKRPMKVIEITEHGKSAFNEYIVKLRQILDEIDKQSDGSVF